jgi:hypothetical protein
LLIVSSTLCACAGKLDQPKRFAAIVQKFGGAAGKGGTGGVGGGRQLPGISDDDGGPSAVDAGSVVLPPCVLTIFGKTCGISGCHAKGSPQIDLASDGVTDRLINKKSTSMTCMGRVYVATDGKASLLLDKLGPTPPCGLRMPVGGMLSATDMKCFSDWVKSLGGSVPDAGGK